MNRKHKVLVTGSAGAVGRAVVKALLARGHEVRGFDRQPSPGLAQEAQRVADLADGPAVQAAVKGCDTVVHLGARPFNGDFITELLPGNLIGMYHIFDACRARRVQRLIMASSIQVIQGCPSPTDRPVSVQDGVCPSNHYALMKVWGEQMGEMYHRVHGLSVIMVRIGWLPRDPEDASHVSQRGRNEYLSHDDAGHFFTGCVEAANIGYEVFFATSRPAQRTTVDIEPARRLIGYEPRDTFPQGLPFAFDGEGSAHPR